LFRFRNPTSKRPPVALPSRAIFRENDWHVNNKINKYKQINQKILNIHIHKKRNYIYTSNILLNVLKLFSYWYIKSIHLLFIKSKHHWYTKKNKKILNYLHEKRLKMLMIEYFRQDLMPNTGTCQNPLSSSLIFLN